MPDNDKTVYCSDCNKSLVMKLSFDERHWIIHAGSPSHHFKLAARKDIDKKTRIDNENPQKNKTQMTQIELYGFKKEKMSKLTHLKISTHNTTLIEVDAKNDNRMTNSTIQIDVDTPNDQPRIECLALTICCKGFLLLNKKVTLKQNMDLIIKYVFIDPSAEHENKLVVNYVHANLYST